MMLPLLLISTIAVVTSHPLDNEWEFFKSEFGKSYHSTEEAHRRLVWEENRRLVAEHNSEAENGLHTFTLGMNKFADLTADEFRQRVSGSSGPCYSSGRRGSRGSRGRGSTKFARRSLGRHIPGYLDWRALGVVTRVKNQELCGSCWSFSATGALESHYAIRKGQLITLSEQQILDCDRNEYNLGCGGGFMESALNYTQHFGIETEDDYPYTARDGYCKYDKKKALVKNTGYVEIRPYDEMGLMESLALHGPVAVGIDATGYKFQLYKSGVYYNPTCGQKPEHLDHGVLVVGYGTENLQEYYIVKNSWGEVWGDNGYIKMAKNRGNNCGIATEASFPTFD